MLTYGQSWSPLSSRCGFEGSFELCLQSQSWQHEYCELGNRGSGRRILEQGSDHTKGTNYVDQVLHADNFLWSELHRVNQMKLIWESQADMVRVSSTLNQHGSTYGSAVPAMA